LTIDRETRSALALLSDDLAFDLKRQIEALGYQDRC
jgi:hypothetical protein